MPHTLGSDFLERALCRLEANQLQFKNYYPVRNQNKVNDTFDFLISHDERFIYKKNNLSSSHFQKLLEDDKTFSSFANILNGNFFSTPMKNHICRGFDLEEDGSYKMKFLHGFRLDLLDTYSLDKVEATEIREQCQILLDNLSKANDDEIFFGDWAMHNLIYCLSEKSIFNVDLEGFITYRPIPEWADFPIVASWLNDTMNQLESITSGL